MPQRRQSSQYREPQAAASSAMATLTVASPSPFHLPPDIAPPLPVPHRAACVGHFVIVVDRLGGGLPGDERADALQELGVRFVTWAVAHPARYRFMFLADEPDALLTPQEQALARGPLAALAAALAAAPLRPGLDPDAAATWLFAGLHGLIALHLQGRLDPETVPDPANFVRVHGAIWSATLFRESPDA